MIDLDFEAEKACFRCVTSGLVVVHAMTWPNRCVTHESYYSRGFFSRQLHADQRAFQRVVLLWMPRRTHACHISPRCVTSTTERRAETLAGQRVVLLWMSR